MVLTLQRNKRRKAPPVRVVFCFASISLREKRKTRAPRRADNIQILRLAQDDSDNFDKNDRPLISRG